MQWAKLVWTTEPAQWQELGLSVVVLVSKRIDWYNVVKTSTTAEIVHVSARSETFKWRPTEPRKWKCWLQVGIGISDIYEETLAWKCMSCSVQWKELWSCRLISNWWGVGSDITVSCQTRCVNFSRSRLWFHLRANVSCASEGGRGMWSHHDTSCEDLRPESGRCLSWRRPRNLVVDSSSVRGCHAEDRDFPNLAGMSESRLSSEALLGQDYAAVILPLKT